MNEKYTSSIEQNSSGEINGPFASQEISNTLWKHFITVFTTGRHYSLQ